MKTIQLKNGVEIWTVEMPNTHSITIGLYIRTGSLYECEENNGINHLIEHLHFRRMNEFSQDELYDKMESIGSTLRAATYKDFIRYSMKIRPEYLALCANIFKNIIETFCWKETEFQLEKQVVLDQIEEENQYVDFRQEILDAVFQNSSYAFPIMGTKNRVENISLKEVLEYKKQNFTSNNFVIVITGNFSFDNLKTAIDQLEKAEINSSKMKNKINAPECKFGIHFIDYDSDYVDVDISFLLDFDHYSHQEILLLNSILGEGVGSELQRALRERLAMTSNICSELELYESWGLLNIRFMVQNSNLLKSFEEIQKVIRSLKDNISDHHLKTTKPFYTENLWYLLDDPEEYNFKLGYETYILNQPYRPIEKMMDEFYQIDTDRIQTVASMVFDSKHAYCVIMGKVDEYTKSKLNKLEI